MTARDRMRGWLELLRLPNLPTVPGDPLAGWLLSVAAGGVAPRAGAAGVAGAMAAALCLYLCGILLNDVADIGEDGRARPWRPLPSGRVPSREAALAATALAGGALVAAFRVSVATGLVAAVLSLAILVYTFVARRWAYAGMVTMGCCRGLSVLLGASAAVGPFAPAALGAAVAVACYVMALSAIARRETDRRRIGAPRFAPLAVGVVGIGAVAALAGTAPVAAGLWLAAFVASGWSNAWALRGVPEPERVGRTVGAFVRGLVPMQASLCALAPCGAWVGGAMALLWCTSAALARRFQAS